MRYKSPERMQIIKDYVEECYAEDYHTPTIAEISGATGIPGSAVQRYLVEMNEKGMLAYSRGYISTEKIEKLKSSKGRGFQSAPIVGTVKCGDPTAAEEYIEAYLALPEGIFGSGEFFILRASGESMIEAGINDGDLVIIRKQETCEDGQIVVALVNGENTLKRFYRDWDRECIRLHPENRTMADIYTTDCQIQGVAVHVLKALK